ncbi:hypothetical protein HAX54_044342 [Datura stramonium]|uniref:Helicase C-terminal domain-containing protein n=1 Tax=Datura stramonium TaxID=4076 RepID=A0ABS8W6K3_DATST|nr:hypothetical protein [Datura stramonium]
MVRTCGSSAAEPPPILSDLNLGPPRQNVGPLGDSKPAMGHVEGLVFEFQNDKAPVKITNGRDKEKRRLTGPYSRPSISKTNPKIAAETALIDFGSLSQPNKATANRGWSRASLATSSLLPNSPRSWKFAEFMEPYPQNREEMIMEVVSTLTTEIQEILPIDREEQIQLIEWYNDEPMGQIQSKEADTTAWNRQYEKSKNSKGLVRPGSPRRVGKIEVKNLVFKPYPAFLQEEISYGDGRKKKHPILYGEEILLHYRGKSFELVEESKGSDIWFLWIERGRRFSSKVKIDEDNLRWNNLDELFMLMHFLDAGKFGSLEEFQQEFEDISQEEQVSRLHKMLAPHLLRRVKKDVMTELPPKKELILRVELSSKQKEYYKAILTRNFQLLTRKGGAQISLINVVMELRKLCCHPFMLEGVEPEDTNEFTKQLLESSGKLQLLDKMMVRLKEQGHRVLIYSQFQHMLDLLEDYCNYRNWQYERIDGKVGGAERQIRIDRFNAKNSSRFCFLLSTRAGGLGINLATADTVIIYDSDWNPHADLQAMARAHRLGQTNKVMIFRLITRGTIEERMMQMTKKKMILEHLVVGRLKAQNINQEELDDIIRYGSKELFADDNDEAGKSRQIHYDDAAIDRLLDREQVRDEDAAVNDEEEDSFLKAFKGNTSGLGKLFRDTINKEDTKKEAKTDPNKGKHRKQTSGECSEETRLDAQKKQVQKRQ